MKELLKKPLFIWFIYLVISVFIVLINTFIIKPDNLKILENIFVFIFWIWLILLFFKKYRFIWQWILIGVVMTIIISILATILFVNLDELNKKSIKIEKTYNSKKYFLKEIWWTVYIPENFIIMDKLEKNKSNEKWIQEIKKYVWEEIEKYDLSVNTNSIDFKIDKTNIFTSSIEPFDEVKDWKWDNYVLDTKNFIFSIYKEKFWENVKQSDIKEVIIDWIKFKYFTFSIYNKSNAILLNQRLYNWLVNWFDLTVTINYNSDENKNKLLNVLLKSKFSNIK